MVANTACLGVHARSGGRSGKLSEFWFIPDINLNLKSPSHALTDPARLQSGLYTSRIQSNKIPCNGEVTQVGLSSFFRRTASSGLLAASDNIRFEIPSLESCHLSYSSPTAKRRIRLHDDVPKESFFLSSCWITMEKNEVRFPAIFSALCLFC